MPFQKLIQSSQMAFSRAFSNVHRSFFRFPSALPRPLRFHRQLPTPQVSTLCSLPRAHSTTVPRECATQEPKAPPWPEFDLIPEDEALYLYSPGNYHPVLIGDILGSRYRVVHKLDHGRFSTSWLCRDEESQTYVALKVGTAESSSDEYNMLDFLNRSSSGNDEPGRAMIPKVLDQFAIEGPNGRHVCFSTSPTLRDVGTALDEEAPFPIDTARSLAAQLLLALDYIHSKGIVHGDLHIRNLRLCPETNELDHLTVDELYAKHPLIPTEPEWKHNAQTLGPDVPAYLKFTIWLGKLPKDCAMPKTKIIIADFGSSYHITADGMHKTRPSLGFAAPEALYDEGRCLSFGSDIWALACVIFEIFGGARLFQDAWNASSDHITWLWVLSLGKLPPEWWDKWEGRSKYFTEDGAIGPGGQPWPGSPISFDERFVDDIQATRLKNGLDAFSVGEALAFKAMLRRMLAYRPEERPTAAELLRCEWMVKWALPELRKSRCVPLMDGKV